MSTTDDFWKLFDQDEARLDKFLAGANQIARMVPFVQEKKDELKATRQALNALPPDAMDEMRPRLMAIRKAEHEEMKAHLPSLPKLTDEQVWYLMASTSSSPVTGMVVEIRSTIPDPAPWVDRAVRPLTDLAEQKARRGVLQDRLQPVSPDLAVIFEEAERSFQRAKAGEITISQAAGPLRDTVETLWGETLKVVRELAPDKVPGKLKLSKEEPREMVAEVLTQFGNRGLIEFALDALAKNQGDLSDMVHDTLYKDLQTFIEIHADVVFHMERLAGWLLLARKR